MTREKDQTCCFTGHRSIPLASRERVRANLVHAISDLYQKGYRHFVAGGALGFDTLAASLVLAFKKHYPDITLTLMLPCADQDSKWSSVEREIYENQKRAADEIICLAPRYYDGCMQKRNQAMVDASSACIAYMTRPRSGAGQTVRMAEKAGLTVINVAPNKDD